MNSKKINLNFNNLVKLLGDQPNLEIALPLEIIMELFKKADTTKIYNFDKWELLSENYKNKPYWELNKLGLYELIDWEGMWPEIDTSFYFTGRCLDCSYQQPEFILTIDGDAAIELQILADYVQGKSVNNKNIIKFLSHFDFLNTQHTLIIKNLIFTGETTLNYDNSDYELNAMDFAELKFV